MVNAFVEGEACSFLVFDLQLYDGDLAFCIYECDQSRMSHLMLV